MQFQKKYQRPSPGGGGGGGWADPGDIRGHGAGFVKFGRQYFNIGMGDWIAFALS